MPLSLRVRCSSPSAIPGDAALPAKASAFVHVVVAGGNVCGTDNHATVLNHPLANGNPNALIVSTSNTGASSARDR